MDEEYFEVVARIPTYIVSKNDTDDTLTDGIRSILKDINTIEAYISMLDTKHKDATHISGEEMKKMFDSHYNRTLLEELVREFNTARAERLHRPIVETSHKD